MFSGWRYGKKWGVEEFAYPWEPWLPRGGSNAQANLHDKKVSEREYAG